jgi:hypothetical protein
MYPHNEKRLIIMKKIPTLFNREFENHRIKTITPDVTPGCEWVLAGEGVATEKLDGTCCLFKDGKLWKRYDAKRGKPIPAGAILCQPEADAVTGHLPCWLPVSETDPSDKWHRLAFENQIASGCGFEENQTYELCGPHFQTNPYKLDHDQFFKHGEKILDNVPRDYDGIHRYLETHMIEGIVFHRGNGDMCKIKRSDFGFTWKVIKRH